MVVEEGRGPVESKLVWDASAALVVTPAPAASVGLHADTTLRGPTGDNDVLIKGCLVEARDRFGNLAPCDGVVTMTVRQAGSAQASTLKLAVGTNAGMSLSYVTSQLALSVARLLSVAVDHARHHSQEWKVRPGGRHRQWRCAGRRV